jgi:hypothetical protein
MTDEPDNAWKSKKGAAKMSVQKSNSDAASRRYWTPGSILRNRKHQLFQMFFMLACLLLTLKYPQFAVAQTCIIVRKMPKEIYVGSDSRRTYTEVTGERSGAVEEITDQVCKISQEGATFFAISGFGGFALSRAVFPSQRLPVLARSGQESLKRLVVSACEQGKTIAEKARAFEQMAADPLTEALEIIRQNNLPYYRQRFADKETCAVIFFGMEGASPAFSVVTFESVNSMSAPVSLVHRVINSSDYPNEVSLTVSTGHHDAIDHLKGDRKFWEIGPVAGITKLIEIQMKATPDKVGGHIDIIKVSKDGAEWIQKKPQCPEIKK